MSHTPASSANPEAAEHKTRITRFIEAFRRARSYAGPERATLLLVVKSAVAATAAWWVASSLLHAESPAFAPFAAILMIQATVHESVLESMRFVAAAVLGVSLQGVLGFFFEANLLTFFTVASIALLLGQWRRLRQQGGLVTTSAFFAYGVFITGGQPGDRVALLTELIGLVLLGCAIGLVVNVAVLPPMRYRGAQYGLANVANSLQDLVSDMVDAMRAGSLSEDGDDWSYRAGHIESLGHQAKDAVTSAQESMRWNPRRLLVRVRPSLAGYSHLIDVVSAVGARLRSVTDVLRRISDTSDPAQTGFLQRYGEFLDCVRSGVEALANIDPGRLNEAESEFSDPVSQAREIHDEMTRMESPGQGADGGHGNLGDARVYGGLLVEAERILLEMEAAADTLRRSPRWTKAR